MTTPHEDSDRMHPGSDIYNPAKYALRVYDDSCRDYPQVFFQASTPFPAFAEGNILSTICWPLGLQGRVVVVKRVVHNIWNSGDDVFNETNLYCEFPPTKPE